MKIILNRAFSEKGIEGTIVKIESAQGFTDYNNITFHLFIHVVVNEINDLRPVKLGVTKEGYIYMINAHRINKRNIGRLFYG